MLFNSVDFLVFFPVVVLLYFVMPRRVRYLWLLGCSYYFYMCWNPRYALLMLTSTAITYLSGILIHRANAVGDEGKRTRLKKLWVGLSFGSNLAILCVFKYLTFFLESLAAALGFAGISMTVPTIDLLLPVGISFYTFQALSYTVDVYRGDIDAEPNFLRYALFVSFFPQLVAGPIERSGSLLRQLREDQTFDYVRVRRGLVLMGWGFFQKVVIADRLAILADTVFNEPAGRSGAAVILAALAFCFQIYCDFGGYSNIAIGAAKVMGIDLMENFRQPYLAANIKDFWRRWHISLSTWFRDYLYIPLGGNRRGRVRAMTNLVIVFLVSGLWHGAAWHYVIWGGLHGFYQVVGAITDPGRRKLRGILSVRENGRLHRICAHAITFALVTFAFMIFRVNCMSDFVTLMHAVVFRLDPASLLGGGLFELGLKKPDFIVAVLSVAVLIVSDLVREKCCPGEILDRQPLPVRWAVYLILIFEILIFGIYGPSYEATAFIYFAF